MTYILSVNAVQALVLSVGKEDGNKAAVGVETLELDHHVDQPVGQAAGNSLLRRVIVKMTFFAYSRPLFARVYSSDGSNQL